MGQIFLLHHPDNREIALQIADFLKQAGYQPVLRLQPDTLPDATLTLLSLDLLKDASAHTLFKQLRAQNIPTIAIKVTPVPTHINGIDATPDLTAGLEQVLNRLSNLNILPNLSPVSTPGNIIVWQAAGATFVGFMMIIGVLFVLLLPGLDSTALEPMPTLYSFSVAEVTSEATEQPVVEATETIVPAPEVTVLPESTPEVLSVFDDADEAEDDSEPIEVYFEPDPYEGIAPLTVSFWNDSYGAYERCEWDFDGDSIADSNTCEPDAIIYENPGAYEVTLTLFDADDNAYSYLDYIDVFAPEDADTDNPAKDTTSQDVLPNILPERPLTALFRASPMEGLAPLRVNFTDLSRGAVVSYQWDLNGDSRPDSQEATPTYTYSQRGDYVVTLTVVDNNGNQDSIDLTIFVYDESDSYVVPTEPPLARFNLSETIGEAPLTVNFKNLSQGYITAYNWDFDSNGSVDSTDRAPSYTFNQPGNYTVTLTVTNDRGEQDTRQSILTVKKPPAPLAGFTANVIEGEAPLVVQFMDASEGDITGYAWDFDGDGVTDSTQANPLYTYTEAGDYEVTLIVSGAGGNSEPEYEYILVEAAQPPEVDFSMSVSSGIAPLSVAFTPASDKEILSYAWDFDGDGQTDSTNANPTMIFTDPGAYEISLLATGKGGESERAYQSLYVSPAAPIAQFVSSVQSGQAPLEVVFINTSTTTIAGLTYRWDFDGDSQTDSEIRDPAHIYTQPGIYEVSLIIENAGVSSERATLLIQVEAANTPEATEAVLITETSVPEVTEDVSITETVVPEVTEDVSITETPSPEVTAEVIITETPVETPSPEATEYISITETPIIPTETPDVEETELPTATEESTVIVTEIVEITPSATTPAPEVTEEPSVNTVEPTEAVIVTTPAPAETESITPDPTTPPPTAATIVTEIPATKTPDPVIIVTTSAPTEPPATDNPTTHTTEAANQDSVENTERDA